MNFKIWIKSVSKEGPIIMRSYHTIYLHDFNWIVDINLDYYYYKWFRSSSNYSIINIII